MADLPVCDKCGKPVEPNNDVLALYLLMGHSKDELLFGEGQSRHILPVGGCEGSPSTFQYLEGQPRDTRGFRYSEERESQVRAAYARLQSSTAVKA